MKTTTPAPTPGALLSAARLAEIRDDADTCREALDEGALDFKHCEQEVYDAAYRLIAEGTRNLLAHLDALQAPCDRETGGRLVRNVWIAWAKEQPRPKASWLVEWEGLSEPDREVDRRIFEACYAAGRASLQAPAPDDDGEALPDLDPQHTPPADRFDGELWRGRVKVDDDWAHVSIWTVDGATVPMFYWHGKWRCVAESFGHEVMSAWARSAFALGAASRQAEIDALTAALADLPTLYDDQVRESQRLARALERVEDERDGAQRDALDNEEARRVWCSRANAMANVLGREEGDFDFEGTAKRAIERACLDGAREEREACARYLAENGDPPGALKLRLRAEAIERARATKGRQG